MKHVAGFRVFRTILIALVLLFFTAIVQAKMTVYFKDGTSRDVSKIEFKGVSAELYLTTGTVMLVPKDSIDYRATGIEKPDADFGVIVYGPGNVEKKQEIQKSIPTGPSQEELKSQWQGSRQSAVAVGDFGGIKKGQTVRIVVGSDLSYTIVAQMPDGSYKRTMIGGENFRENFEITGSAGGNTSTTPHTDLQVPLNPDKKPETEPLRTSRSTPSRPAPIPNKISLLLPLLLGGGILTLGLISTMLLSKSNEGKRISRR